MILNNSKPTLHFIVKFVLYHGSSIILKFARFIHDEDMQYRVCIQYRVCGIFLDTLNPTNNDIGPRGHTRGILHIELDNTSIETCTIPGVQ